jgi:hypothetical protein
MEAQNGSKWTGGDLAIWGHPGVKKSIFSKFLKTDGESKEMFGDIK